MRDATALAVAALALAACGPTTDQVAAPETAKDALRVCFAENDPPRSRRGGDGFDTDVAREIAAQLDRRLVIVWLPEEEQTDIESTDADYRPLLTGQCHLQLSVPGAAAVERYRGWLVLSEPYYGAAFELVPADASFRFGEPYPEIIAVRANSVAHLALDATGVRWSQQATNEGILGALADGSAAAGLVWGPHLALLDVERNADFEVPPVLRWNLHAALRKDNPLRADVDRILSSASFQERIPELLARHGVPARGPFASVHTAALLQSL